MDTQTETTNGAVDTAPPAAAAPVRGRRRAASTTAAAEGTPATGDAATPKRRRKGFKRRTAADIAAAAGTFTLQNLPPVSSLPITYMIEVCEELKKLGKQINKATNFVVSTTAPSTTE